MFTARASVAENDTARRPRHTGGVFGDCCGPAVALLSIRSLYFLFFPSIHVEDDEHSLPSPAISIQRRFLHRKRCRTAIGILYLSVSRALTPCLVLSCLTYPEEKSHPQNIRHFVAICRQSWDDLDVEFFHIYTLCPTPRARDKSSRLS